MESWLFLSARLGTRMAVAFFWLLSFLLRVLAGISSWIVALLGGWPAVGGLKLRSGHEGGYALLMLYAFIYTTCCFQVCGDIYLSEKNVFSLFMYENQAVAMCVWREQKPVHCNFRYFR